MARFSKAQNVANNTPFSKGLWLAGDSSWLGVLPCCSLSLNILNTASSPWEHLMRPQAYPLRRCNSPPHFPTVSSGSESLPLVNTIMFQVSKTPKACLATSLLWAEQDGRLQETQESLRKAGSTFWVFSVFASPSCTSGATRNPKNKLLVTAAKIVGDLWRQGAFKVWIA